MADSKPIGKVARAVAPKTGVSPKTSKTPPGPTESEPADTDNRRELVDAINQVFALFRLNYHNQFYAAFPDAEQLKQIKRLWLEALADYPPSMILRGAKHAIESCDYLPTLNRMFEACIQGLADAGLPSPREAYLEACTAASPKADYSWSHPAVYLAGRDSDWFFLGNNPERTTWPVFRKHYERYVLKALQGETLTVPERPAITGPDSTSSMTVEERKAALEKIRRETGL